MTGSKRKRKKFFSRTGLECFSVTWEIGSDEEVYKGMEKGTKAKLSFISL